MSKRSEHLFQFTGNDIGEAAKAEAKYHSERAAYWNGEYEKAVVEARSATVEVTERDVTGGKMADVHINTTAAHRLNEASGKRQKHKDQSDRFQIEAAAYSSQKMRSYELDASDVVYFRLAGGPRD